MHRAILLFCLIACNSIAQSKITFSEQLFLDHYNQLKQLTLQSPAKALKHLDQLLNLYEEQITPIQRVKLLFIKAENQIALEQIEQAFDTLSQNKQSIDELNLSDQPYYYYTLSAKAFDHLAMYNLAMANYLSAYELALAIEDDEKTIATQTSVGKGFVNLKRYEEASYFFDIVEQSAKKSENINQILASHINQGILDYYQEKYSDAVQHFEQVLADHQTNKNVNHASEAYYWLAKINLMLGNYQQAKQQLEQSLLNNHSAALHRFSIKLVETELAIAEERYQDALSLLNQIENQVKQHNYHSLYDNILLLKKRIFQETGDTQQALTAVEQYIANKNHLEHLRSRVGLSHYIAQIELAGKELDIMNLKREKELAAERAKASRLLTIVVTSSSSLIIVITLVFLISNRKKNNQLIKFIDKLRSTQKALVASENMSALTTLVSGMAHQLNTPLGIVITANSIMKDKIAELAQQFTDKKLNHSAMEEFIDSATDTLKLTEKNSEKVAGLISRFKLISAKLEGSEANDFQVVSFLNEKLELLKNQYHNKFTYDVSGDDVMINNYPDVLLKTLEQLVENSCYHGVKKDESIHIMLTIVDQVQQVEIHYQDNGKGIAPEKINKIFNPFFTTNTMQESLGLGMNIVYNSVVELMQGNIRCQMSARGANFFISLPKSLSAKTIIEEAIELND